MLQNSTRSSQVGLIVTFAYDPGFHFEIHVISISSNSITTELQVTAVRQLNGVTVECAGPSGPSMYVIQVAPIGEF